MLLLNVFDESSELLAQFRLAASVSSFVFSLQETFGHVGLVGRLHKVISVHLMLLCSLLKTLSSLMIE